MKIKFISSNYNQKTGVSTVIVQYKDKFYTGNAVLSPEDKTDGYESRFLGCQIAEIRARKECIKSKIHDLKLQLKGAQRLAAAILPQGKEILSPTVYKFINRQIKCFIKNLNNDVCCLKNQISSYDGSIKLIVDKAITRKEKFNRKEEI